MNLYFRLLLTIVHSFFRKKLHPLAESVLHLRALPSDLDLNVHVNNGRFLSLMDLGRVDLMLRTGLSSVALKHRWAPLVGGVNIRYRYSIKPFQRFRLRTQAIGWDDKWFYIEQRFERGNRTLAVALVKAMFRGPRGNVQPETVLKLVHVNIDPPELPEKVRLALSLYDHL